MSYDLFGEMGARPGRKEESSTSMVTNREYSVVVHRGLPNKAKSAN